MKRSFYEDFAGIPAWDLGMEGTFFINLEKRKRCWQDFWQGKGRVLRDGSVWRLCIYCAGLRIFA